jgi:hypothetical protein
MKEVSALLIALLCWSMAAAQTGKQIAIIVVDSFNNVKMTNASIIITRASNSALMISGRTNTSGYCLLSIKDSGRYVLQVSYPGYSDYSQKIIVSDRQVQTPHYLVSLIPIAHLLEEVVVKNEIMKIRMNGDTMEYRADSFLTDRNASVEDLLKKLPGITVDAGGKISVYGKRINKILIGGEEYFGEDPALVSRSLRSNIVQKVQVFDKLSDQAAFSKINDGKAVKAINLELKADKKKGYFGKAEGGAGFGNFYKNQLLINRFNGDQKFALYFIQSNVGTTGLNWQDTRTYSDFSLTSQESGGFTTSQTSSLENWDGSYQKQGIPFVTSLGVHYSDKLNDRFSINDSYRFYLINLDVKTISDQQFNLNNAFYLRKQNTTINNNARSNREIVKTTVKLSKKSDLLVGLDLNTGNKNIYNTLASSLYLDTVHKLNTQGRTLQINGRENNFTGTILWRTRFSSGSTLTISGKILCNANEFNGYLVSKDSLFQNNLLSQDSLTDQYKKEVFHNLGYNTKTVFSLPINVHSNLSLSADYTQNSSENSVVSFNRNSAGQYALEDLSLTDKYTLTGQNATLGLGYNFSKGKILLNAMVDAGQSFLKQQIENKTAFVKS